MRFYLGSHHATQRWFDLGVPLFVSRRVLAPRRRLPEPRAPWALDSGGFTELSLHGRWVTTEDEYVADVERLAGVDWLEWAAPQDWMCEPFMLAKTGLTVADHQRLTVDNFVRLRDRLGGLVVPVVQGWEPDDYLACWQLYEAAGVDLAAEPVVGVGSVCRRQNMAVAGRIVRGLAPLRLHGFGVKTAGLVSFSDALESADSMAWSYSGRYEPGCGPSHKSEANCPRYAMRWRQGVLHSLAQTRLEIAA